jgi:hypothetical protein
MAMTSRNQPSTNEDLCLHIALDVGNGHAHQNQAELQQHNELRHCWLPGQNNSLPFLIKNKTKLPKHTRTHTTTDRLIIETFTNSQHLQLIQNFAFPKQNFNILAFATSNSDSTSNNVFGYVGGISTLYANMSNYTFNFKHFLVMSVGFPLFMQTNLTSGKFLL